jgi:SAM-dependent methyltransferase
MLRRAAVTAAAYGDRLTLLWQDVTELPFSDGVFDAATCLEALEFLPDARATLGEIARVLRPGGLVLLSNRIGPGVRWLPGRTVSREGLLTLLEALSFEDVRFAAWQMDYDLAWARKRPRGLSQNPDQPSGTRPFTLPALLRCPCCRSGPLLRQERAFGCDRCGARFPIADDGVLEMVQSRRSPAPNLA